MLPQIKVYVTSKREHADKIRAAVPDGFHLNARWVYMRGTEERPVTHWLQENFDDAAASHYVVFYVEPGDHLRTSLIELGNAIAYGKKIYIAGDKMRAEGSGYFPHKDLMPWAAFSSHVKITGSLAQTFDFIKREVFQREGIVNKSKIRI